MGEQTTLTPLPASTGAITASIDATLAPAAPKPGFRTSEFWLKVAAFVLTTLLASGAIPTSSAAAQWIAMISTMVGSMVYTASRTSVKNANQEGAQ